MLKPLGVQSTNFEFLRASDERLARLAGDAERYFASDASAALVKLRAMGERMVRLLAAHQALSFNSDVSFDDVLRALRSRGLLPQRVSEILYHVKRVGNSAAHEDAGTVGEALTALRMMREAGVWFHRTYGAAPNFKAGPFVPPAPPVDRTADLSAQLAELRATVLASKDAEAKAALAAQEAEAARLAALDAAAREREEREFWENYAAETEQSEKIAQADLAAVRAEAERSTPEQLDLLARAGSEAAAKIELDEASTHVLIDEQLRAAGWEVDSAVFRHAAGTRPVYGKAMAIAEWPTRTGPVDYALFIDGRCVGVIEAKRKTVDVPGRLPQAKRYATGITLTPDELPTGGPWTDGGDRFQVPFLFATNGRPYVKQLATKSGIWFWDARTGAAPRALPEWFSPRDLTEKLEQELGPAPETVADHELGISGLRPYQKDAVAAVQTAVGEGQSHILLAMATGTGKTRLAIALMYELLKAKRFRRILFLVDR